MKERMRMALRLTLSWVFGLLARPLSLSATSGPCLILAPHSDDETLGCANLICQMRELSRRVVVVVVTDGSQCQLASRMDKDDLIKLRRAETTAACHELGLRDEDIKFLDFPDGALARLEDDIVKTIRAIYREVSPSVILSPLIHDTHSDHEALARVTQKLADAEKFKGAVFEYPVWLPAKRGWRLLMDATFRRRLRRIRSRHNPAKSRALRQYRSQRANALETGIDGALGADFERLFLGTYEVFLGNALEA